MVGGEIMFIARTTAEKLFDIHGVNTIMVMARPDSLGAVHDALAQIARRHQLMLHSFADLSRMLDRMMGGVIGGLWAILALGFVVAAFGIANTLTMSVLEQTRELALLRVVAMTRRQVRRFVLSQAGHHRTYRAGAGHRRRHRHGLRHQPEHDAVVGLPGRLPLCIPGWCWEASASGSSWCLSPRWPRRRGPRGWTCESPCSTNDAENPCGPGSPRLPDRLGKRIMRTVSAVAVRVP